MGVNLPSPLLFQSVPWGDSDAFLDFLGVEMQWHLALARATKTRLVTLDDLRHNLKPHAQMHDDLATALNLAKASDLVSADLTKREDFEGWMETNALDLDRLRKAANL